MKMHLRQREITLNWFENFQTKETFEPQHIWLGVSYFADDNTII